MKTILRTSLFAILIFSFSSCVKTYEAPPVVVSDPLAGSWYLYDASESYGNGWYPFNAHINGVFSFYSNGSAQYDDGYNLMQGDWYTADASEGYYDRYGNYYTNPHTTFSTSLNGGNGATLDLYFDDIVFSGNSEFTGTYYTGKSIERYIFYRNN